MKERKEIPRNDKQEILPEKNIHQKKKEKNVTKEKNVMEKKNEKNMKRQIYMPVKQ